MLQDPFPGFNISDSAFLDLTDTRYKCKTCMKSRKFFCYTCCTPNPYLDHWLPKVKLPVKIDIIKHKNECDGKSTSPHAAILAPGDVTIYTFPCIPDYDPYKNILVFPCKDATTLKELAAELATAACTLRDDGSQNDTPPEADNADVDTEATDDSQQEEKLTPSGKRLAQSESSEHEARPGKRPRVAKQPFERAIFIDSTWNQTNGIIKDERLKNLRRVELRGHETHFWRCQEGIPTSSLSTIEAIRHFMVEYHRDMLSLPPTNHYDNLLFFFMHTYRTIRRHQQEGRHLKAYTRKETNKGNKQEEKEEKEENKDEKEEEKKNKQENMQEEEKEEKDKPTL